MVVSLRVLKEPRGFIRVIQCVLAILAFSTTAAFETFCSFEVHCPGDDNDKEIEYEFGYPFRFRDNILTVDHCEDDKADHVLRLPFDFSTTAVFFVAVGVVTFFYTLIILVVYIFFHQLYANDPKVPVIDLGLTAVLTIFWLAGSSAWAQGVSDLKYYLDPDNLFGMIPACTDEEDGDDDACDTEHEGGYAALNVSLIFGFACFLLWLSSLWFVYKETVFHTPAPTTPATEGQNQTTKSDGRV